jgi:nitrate/TMAO reductase-like tetraheme cytochrome c subunit
MSDPVEPDAPRPAPARAAAAVGGTGAAAAEHEAASEAASEAAAEAVETEAASEAAAEAAWEAAWEAGYKAASTAAGQAEPAPQEHRHPFYLRGRHLRLPQSRRGLFALLLVLGGAGFIAVFASVSLIHWTETADFCGRCHTMAPELQAYEAGPHKNVACAECHVEPGITGWLKAKINGTKQLIEVVLGTFPTPIPPPEHSDMPSSADTCEGCHGVTRDAVKTLKTETVYTEDEKNTAQFVGLMIRPGGGNPFDVARSVHWHVLRTVHFYSGDPRDQTIDLVEATQPDGSIATYMSLAKVKDTGDVVPDVEAVQTSDVKTRMSCYDCHNRAGHDIANPRTGIDSALTAGTVDKTLPYVKREAMRILYGSYDSVGAADAEADKLPAFYQTNYPLVAASQSKQIAAAVSEIKVLYRLTATPEMKVSAKTYPNNLGHLDFPGCFRCHDGAHYKVVGGQLTQSVIPSTCDTCHTFPQIGPAVASLPLGEPPSTHTDALWVFNHKTVATSIDPGTQSCGTCHAKDYCVNCHSTGAVTVDHDEMATNHAAVIRRQGNSACAYCHQPVFCATCHGTTPVLPVTTPFLQGSVAAPLASTDGVTYPLQAAARPTNKS